MYGRFFGGRGGGPNKDDGKPQQQDGEGTGTAQQRSPARPPPRRVPSASEMAASLFESSAFYNLGRVLQEQQSQSQHQGQHQQQPQHDYDFHHYHRGRPLSESAPVPPSRLQGAAGRGDGEEEPSDSLLLCNIRPQDVPRAGQHPYYQEADYLHPHEAAGGGAASGAGGRPFRSMCDGLLLHHGRLGGADSGAASGISNSGVLVGGDADFFHRAASPASASGSAGGGRGSLRDSVDSTSFVVSGFGTISPSFGTGGGYSSVSSTSSADSQMEKGAAASSGDRRGRLHISPSSSEDLGASFQGPPHATYGISEILAGAEAHNLPLPCLPSPTSASASVASASPFQYFFGRKPSQASLASAASSSSMAGAEAAAAAAAGAGAERKERETGEMSTVWEVEGGSSIISLQHLRLAVRCLRDAAEGAVEAMLGRADDAGNKPLASSSCSSSASASASFIAASPKEHRCFVLGLVLGCLACVLLLLTGAGPALAPFIFGARGRSPFPYYHYPYGGGGGERGMYRNAGAGAAHHLPFMSLPATPGGSNTNGDLPQPPSAQGLSLFGTRKTQQIISKQVLTSKDEAAAAASAAAIGGAGAGGSGAGGAGGEPLATGSGGFWAAVAEFLGTQQGDSEAAGSDNGSGGSGSNGGRRGGGGSGSFKRGPSLLLPSLALRLPRLRLPDAAEVATTVAAASAGLWHVVTQSLCNLLLSLLRKLPFVPSDLGKRHWHQKQQQQQTTTTTTTTTEATA